MSLVYFAPNVTEAEYKVMYKLHFHYRIRSASNEVDKIKLGVFGGLGRKILLINDLFTQLIMHMYHTWVAEDSKPSSVKPLSETKSFLYFAVC